MKLFSGNRDPYGLSKADIAVIAFLLVFSAASILAAGRGGARLKGNAFKASIYYAGELIREVDTRKEEETSILEGRMLIRTSPGKVMVARSDCPRQICVRRGWAGVIDQPVVCAENKVFIEFDREDKRRKFLDAVSY